MPNAAKLFAALSLALLALVVSALILPLLPDGTNFEKFTLVNVAIGALTGWHVMGKRAGQGVTLAINNGLTGMAVMVFWGLFVQGCNEMVRLAMRNRYDGPFDAIKAVFEIGYEYALVIMVPSVVLTLLAGGIVAGFVANYAKKRWR